MANSRPTLISVILRALGYLAILVVLLILYSSGSFKTPEFIYQGF